MTANLAAALNPNGIANNRAAVLILHANETQSVTVDSAGAFISVLHQQTSHVVHGVSCKELYHETFKKISHPLKVGEIQIQPLNYGGIKLIR